MNSRAISTQVLAAFLVAVVLASSMPSAMAYLGNATYINYKPEEHNYEWRNVNCERLNKDNFDDEYRSRYPWAEFCGELEPGVDVCHKCLVVRNQATSNGGNDDGGGDGSDDGGGDNVNDEGSDDHSGDGSDVVSVTLRIIETCDPLAVGDLVLWMDQPAFEQIDTDGRGHALGGQGWGRLEVNYEMVDCQDPADPE